MMQKKGLHVSPSAYAAMVHMLKTLAAGKVVVVLEGGYLPRHVYRHGHGHVNRLVSRHVG